PRTSTSYSCRTPTPAPRSSIWRRTGSVPTASRRLWWRPERWRSAVGWRGTPTAGWSRTAQRAAPRGRPRAPGGAPTLPGRRALARVRGAARAGRAEGRLHAARRRAGSCWGVDPVGVKPPVTPESRTALITGASSGLGAAIALERAARGWKVAIGARRADRLAETAEQARAQ